MSWDITITPPPSMPDVQEPICSFSSCPGNMYVAILEMKGKQLREMDSNEAIEALKDLVVEVEKGNEGRFNDSYAVDADRKWSEGKETTKEWEKIQPYIHRAKWPFTNYEEFCGYELRRRVRETTVRFLLYYKSGYEISYHW